MDAHQTTEAIVLYVQLLDEGTCVYRPTAAKPLDNGLYELLPTPDYDPEDEKWEFTPGSIVQTAQMDLAEGRVLVAAARQIDRKNQP